MKKIMKKFFHRIEKFTDYIKHSTNLVSGEKLLRLNEELHRLDDWFDKWQIPNSCTKYKVTHIGYLNPLAEYFI